MIGVEENLYSTIIKLIDSMNEENSDANKKISKGKVFIIGIHDFVMILYTQ